MLNYRYCSLTLIFVITLTFHVIEYPVRTPPLERHSTCLPGWAEARKFNTDHVWEHLTVSSEFTSSVGVGYCVLSKLIATSINFDLMV